MISWWSSGNSLPALIQAVRPMNVVVGLKNLHGTLGFTCSKTNSAILYQSTDQTGPTGFRAQIATEGKLRLRQLDFYCSNGLEEYRVLIIHIYRCIHLNLLRWSAKLVH
jgi:hypothetical protein